MSQRVCLALGNGRYAVELFEKLRGDSRTSLVAALGQSLFHGKIDLHIDLKNPAQFLEDLKANNVTHVILGGDFRLDMATRADAKRDPVGREILANRTLGSALQRVGDLLRQAGVEPLLASEFLPELVPGAGVICSGKVSLQQDELAALCTAYAERARAELGKQPVKSVRQAMLFDDDVMLPPTTQGTDNLLKQAATIPKGSLRVLAKMCPAQFNYRLDPPVIGPKTITGAKKAQVDIIILEASKGIISRRDKALKSAADAGIAIYGVE